jgi:D-ribulokinase
MAILAASSGRKIAEVAANMVRIREVIEPRARQTKIFLEPYLRLVDEFGRRDWLAPSVVEHANRRAVT